MRTRESVVGLLLAVSLAGCGGVAAKAEPKLTLKQACPLIEKVIQDADDGEMFTSPTKAQTILDAMAKLAKRSDTEARNAIDVLVEAERVLANDPKPGQDSIDAMSRETSAFETLATRCAAVGSSAFQ